MRFKAPFTPFRRHPNMTKMTIWGTLSGKAPIKRQLLYKVIYSYMLFQFLAEPLLLFTAPLCAVAPWLGITPLKAVVDIFFVCWKKATIANTCLILDLSGGFVRRTFCSKSTKTLQFLQKNANLSLIDYSIVLTQKHFCGPVVNFINILRAASMQLFLHQKITKPKYKLRKASHNTFKRKGASIMLMK